MKWRRSTRCEAGACVEVAFPKNWAAAYVRDSKNTGPVLAFSRTTWTGFINGIKND